MTGIDKSVSLNIRITDPNSGKLCERGETANIINCFFTDVGPRLAAIIPDVNDPQTLVESEWESGPIGPLSHESLLEILDGFNPAKSSGCLSINSKSYLIIFGVLPEQLSFIFNLSLKKGKIPREWKQGLVTTTPKKGDISLVDNWHPISRKEPTFVAKY